MTKRKKGKFKVFSMCGFPVFRRHDPSCTRAHRAEEGCWCGIDYDVRGSARLTARQWRAQRRQVVRRRRAFDRLYGVTR